MSKLLRIAMITALLAVTTPSVYAEDVTLDTTGQEYNVSFVEYQFNQSYKLSAKRYYQPMTITGTLVSAYWDSSDFFCIDIGFSDGQVRHIMMKGTERNFKMIDSISEGDTITIKAKLKWGFVDKQVYWLSGEFVEGDL